MKEKILNEKVKKIHFTGVLGVSNSALVKYLLRQNYVISGSDNDKNGNYLTLNELGANVSYRHSARKVKGADLLVYSSAIFDKNPEIKYAKKKGIRTVKRSELLGEILSEHKNVIAVSGCHGKTTATSMIADMLVLDGKRPTVFVGGETVAFGNFLCGEKDLALAEACEYKKNFLDLKPTVSVVLNIDNDHLDSYKDQNDLINTFETFIKGSVAIINADDNLVTKLATSSAITYGVKNNAVITASNIKRGERGYSFTACAYGRPLGKINLSVFGEHNIYNALATLAVAEQYKIPFSVAKSALENFKGVYRRNEFIGEFNGAKCFADYAHHPSEISATLKAFSENFKDFAVVFQPHTYSRTKYLLDDFCTSLKGAENLAIYKTYAAREKFDKDASATALYERLKDYPYKSLFVLETEKEIEKIMLEFSKKYKAIIFLGAGDIYRLAKNIVDTH